LLWSQNATQHLVFDRALHVASEIIFCVQLIFVAFLGWSVGIAPRPCLSKQEIPSLITTPSVEVLALPEPPTLCGVVLMF
jgi:hypothetical protein